MTTYDFRIPPGPDTLKLAKLAEELGYNRVWCPEIPAFGHDIWVTLARILENTEKIGVGVAVLIPSFRHAVSQACAIATLESISPGRTVLGFGTGLTGRGGLGKPPLKLAYMREYMSQLRGLLNGESVEIEGSLTQMTPFAGWHPEYPINVPFYLAAQGPKGQALAHDLADGLIVMQQPVSGFETCYMPISGTVFDDGEDFSSPRVQAALAPTVALSYHYAYTVKPESVKALPNGEAWLSKVEELPENARHISVHRGHTYEIGSEQDLLIDNSQGQIPSFSGKRDELRARLDEFAKAGATGFIFSSSGTDMEREMRAFAEVAGLK